MTGPAPRSARRPAGLLALTVALVLSMAPAALAATPFTDIHSAGPLGDIYIGNDLSCQVRSGGFSSTEFFPNAAGPGDCGTFFNTGSDTATQELLGPDFANHAGGTHTSFSNEVPVTPASQSLSGSGTTASPYVVTTVVTAHDPFPGNPDLVFQITELDTYVVGQSSYRTDVTVANISDVDQNASGAFYHAADCQLRGSDTGFGSAEPPFGATVFGVACTLAPSNDQVRERFVPLTPSGAGFSETTAPALWQALSGGGSLPALCDSCASNVDNATGIRWGVPSLAAHTSQTFSFLTEIVDTVPTGGFTFSGPAGSSVGGTVATITDPNTSATPSTYSATINWGDGTTSPGTITGGNGSFNVAGTHPYTAGGLYPIAVTITSVGTSLGSSTVTDSAAITAAPTPVTTGAPSVTSTGAGFSGSANPNGLPTTAFFQYGLDPKYTGAGPVAYTQSTAPQTVGADFTAHSVTASVGGLVPHALYHVRLVATNSAGTTVGPDVTFITQPGPPVTAPKLGKTFNIAPVSGVVLIRMHGQLIPLTQLRQIPKNTLIDALRGTLSLTTAVPGNGGGAHDAAAKRKQHRIRTQSGRFGGAVFKITQGRSGLATLSLVEGAIKGGPSFGTCKARKAAEATAAALSSKTLQLLHASAKGKFSTKGRYSAATVRGTKWTVADRCDGTLTHVTTDSVAVTDFVRHKTIILHSGQRYLAKPRKKP